MEESILIKPLTDREREILILMNEGLTNGEIAIRLSLALTTVKWYNTQTFKKLGVENRRQAVEQFRNSRSDIVRRDDLLAATTPFIGRGLEKAKLIDLLREPTCRLVTVLGAGGMGKTRLALAAADHVRADFPDGVYFIPADALHTPDDLARAVAKHTGYPFSDSKNIQEQLLDWLRQRAMLLVFDSFELALGCVPFVTDLLETAGRIQILITSRQRLNLHAETVFSLAGMAYPPDNRSAVDRRYDAVQLFVETARRVQPEWTLTRANSHCVTRICRLTEGMPLGIVLAASWLDVAPVDRIQGEIERSIDFLARDLQDLPQRQHSIRAVLDSTWKYLPSAEQQIFMKLSIFRGGFTLTAAETVTGADLFALQNLMNKALLYRVNENRFDIHNLLRQYGEEHAQHSDLAHVEAAHARFFTDRVRRALVHSQAGKHRTALDSIQQEYENIQRAWNWTVQQRDYTLLSDLIEGLYFFGFTRFHSEKLFRHGLNVLGPEQDIIRAHLVVRSWDFIDHPQQELARILPILRQHDAPHLTAACLQTLAWLSYDLDHDPAAAIRYHRQTLAFFHSVGDQVTELNVLCNLGLCSARLGNLAAARMYYDQGQALHQDHTLEHTFLLALTAEHALLSGDFVTAEARYVQALKKTRHLKVRWGQLWNIGCLGLVKLLYGDLASARSLAKRIVLSDGRHHDQLAALVLLGMIANLDQKYEDAWQYCDMTQARENQYGYSPLYLGPIGQAIAACGMGDLAAAQQRLYGVWDALEYSPALRVLCLPVIAYLHADCDQMIPAVEALSLAAHHALAVPNGLQHWPLFTTLRARLEQQVPRLTFHAAWERGRSLSLMDMRLP